MNCNLKRTVEVRANCEFERCVFWRQLHDASGSERCACILDHLNLIGPHPDRLTRWLLHYKLSRQRARVTALLRQRHTNHLHVG